ncbi:MAG: sodium-dependent transporter [Natronomonas sp.]
MVSSPIVRETWQSRLGFVLAAVGGAVGLGNIWRFPFQTGQEGGAAFLVVYLVFILLVGLPAMLVELTVGRRTKRNAVGALEQTGGKHWRYLGGLFVVVGFIILSYYSVVSGWVLRYFLGSFTGGYLTGPEAYFESVSTGLDAVVFHAIFMTVVVAIVAGGVRRGIEAAVRIIVPGIVLLMVALAIYAATLPDVGVAYAYYLSPDFEVLARGWRSIVPAAAGQAFFTLSLGMGALLTYASYISEDRNLLVDSGAIIVFDTGIAILTGLVVFPILFATGVGAVSPGPGAIFVALAGAFGGLPYGRVLGVVFFGAFAMAALSSALSLMEVIVAYLIDEHDIDRRLAAAGIGGGVFFLGIPVTMDEVFLELYDRLAAEVLLVVGGLLLAILVGWIVAKDAVDELERGIGDLGRVGSMWIWLVRIPVVVVLLVALYLAVIGYVEFLQTEFVGSPFG